MQFYENSLGIIEVSGLIRGKDSKIFGKHTFGDIFKKQ